MIIDTQLRRPLIALLGALALLAACETRDADAPVGEPTSGGIGVVCTGAMPAGLNPFTSPDELTADLRLLLFTPLVLYDGDASFRPHLATGWSWDDARQRLTFELRDDVTWHDGTPVTAQDVVWTVRTAADIQYGYWRGDELQPLRDVSAPGPTTVELSFDRPFTADLEPFVGLPILPRHLLADLRIDEFPTAEYHRSPVGSGPFRFAGRTPDGSLRFDRYDGFPEDLGRPHLDRIVLRAIPEPSTLVVEVTTGGVDLCVAGSSIAREVQGSARIRTLPVEPAGVQVIPLDTRREPLSDVRVRRAVSAALARAELASVISPVAVPAGTFLPPASAGTDPEMLQPDDDRALAVSLLESAGWTTIDPQGIRRNAAGQPLRFTIVAPTGYENLLTVVHSQLRRVGIDVQLRFMETAAFFGALRDPDTRPEAMALVFAPTQHFNHNAYPELHSTGHSNLASYSDPHVDAVLARLESETDPGQRRALYGELQRKVAEDVPTVYTLYVPRVAVIGARLQGVEVDLNGPFTSVVDWWIPDGQRRTRR